MDVASGRPRLVLPFLAPTGAQGEAMLCVRVSIRPCMRVSIRVFVRASLRP